MTTRRGGKRARVARPKASPAAEGGARPPSRDAGPTTPARTIYLLSDSTGNLGRHMLAALLTQFPPGAFDVRPIGFLQAAADLDRAFALVREPPGIVLHSVVDPAHKRVIAERCTGLGVPSYDLTGGAVAFIARASGLVPTPNTRRLHEVNAEYERRIAAIEFVLAHDDGLGMDTLDQADLVLAGVSRTSKTPTSIYLAQQGYRVANVALAIETGVPAALATVPPGRGVGLVIAPDVLAEIRQRRQAAWGMAPTRYGDREHVRREVAWSRRLFVNRGWSVVDVTNQAVEETAARIIAALGPRPPAAPPATPA